MIARIQTENEFQKLLQSSHRKPVFLFKHSTACPTSAMAWRSFSAFADGQHEAEFARVLVIEDRSLARQIADVTGIRHQSPQVILFWKGEPIWNESHWHISEGSLDAALKSLPQHSAE